MPPDNRNCFCCSDLPFELCCQPIIGGIKKASNAESLMRSRFSAYAIKDYTYILNTYAKAQRSMLSLAELEQNAEDTNWLSLQVISDSSNVTTAQVEFKAFYNVGKCFYVIHELSDFVLESENWRYSTGKIQEGTGEIKPERNSLCLCISGKKFKKCCGK